MPLGGSAIDAQSQHDRSRVLPLLCPVNPGGCTAMLADRGGLSGAAEHHGKIVCEIRHRGIGPQRSRGAMQGAQILPRGAREGPAGVRADSYAERYSGENVPIFDPGRIWPGTIRDERGDRGGLRPEAESVSGSEIGGYSDFRVLQVPATLKAVGPAIPA